MLNKLKKSLFWKYVKLRCGSVIALFFTISGLCVFTGLTVFGIDFKRISSIDRLLVALVLVTVGIIVSLVADRKRHAKKNQT